MLDFFKNKLYFFNYIKINQLSNYQIINYLLISSKFFFGINFVL